ncbi:MAG: monooxygenase, FAD-binding [Candidatus Acidoferrum typicum]|nr:monooxygenase, FAD-binding [Candidatus Acidoferrum typicum]
MAFLIQLRLRIGHLMVATVPHRLSVNSHADVIIIGAGPAGIATAIAASQRGLRTVVFDARTPPIDKPCGEGLLPQGVATLRDLGIQLNSDLAVPLEGIRFAGGECSAYAKFPDAPGFALRRVRLHQLLVERAIEAGIIFQWSTRVTKIDSRQVTAGRMQIPYTWLVGADGQNSFVRKWAKLGPVRTNGHRFGFRQHFRVRSWPNRVDAHWGRHCQMLSTPIAAHEVCVSVLSRDANLRISQALPQFPELAGRLRDATPVTRELGNATSLNRFAAVTRGRMALVGDASGSVDAITGHGLSLAFHQAILLAEAFERGNLAHYESAHRKIAVMPALMSRLMLMMDRNSWVRRKTLHLFENMPDLFSKLLSIHTGTVPLSSVSHGEMIGIAWKLLRT